MALSKPPPSWQIEKSALNISNTKLGDGRYSNVYRAKWHQEDGEDIEVAAKILPNQCASQSEIEILSDLSKYPHPNVIKFYGVVKEGNTIIVTEIASNRSLHDYLKEQKRLGKRLPPERIREWAIQMARAIEHLHKHNVMHRDIKSPNFLVMEDMTLKVCDFGISVPDHDTMTTSTKRGSLRWMAPELHEDEKVSMKSDIFSYGTVLWELFTCEEPYHEYQKELKLLNAVMNKGEGLEIPEECPKYLKDIITRCRQTDKNTRPTIEEILKALQIDQNAENISPDVDQTDVDDGKVDLADSVKNLTLTSQPVNNDHSGQLMSQQPSSEESGNSSSPTNPGSDNNASSSSVPEESHQSGQLMSQQASSEESGNSSSPTNPGSDNNASSSSVPEESHISSSIAPLQSITQTAIQESAQFPSYNNWVKSSEGLVECSLALAMIVEKVMCKWHISVTEKKETDLKCAGYPKCNPKLDNGIPNKPKHGRGYCAQCVKFAKVIDDILAVKKPPYDVYWKHVKSSDFFGSPIQVAKLFGLRLIPADELAAITTFDKFDSAWLLSIMEKVNLFHEGDIRLQVQNATTMRNKIMHRPVSLEMTDAVMNGYLDSQVELLQCFGQHFPDIITEKDASNILERLDKIRQIRDMNKVTPDMVQRTVISFMKQVESWQTETDKTMNGLVNICKDFPDLQVKLQMRLMKVENDMETIKGQLSQQPSSEESGNSSLPTIPSSDNNASSSSVQEESHQSGSERHTYDILLIHSEKDMDSAMYKDLDKFFRKEQLSVISMHELPGGKNEFSNFYKALEACSFSMCLLTTQFLQDYKCDKPYIMACYRAVRKRDESVLYVTEAGFEEDDMPPGLMGISGIDHGSRFFKNTLKNTFRDLPRRNEETQGYSDSAANAPQIKQEDARGEQAIHDADKTTIQGSNNLVLGSIVNSTVTIVMSPQEAARHMPVNNNSHHQDESLTQPLMHHQDESLTQPPMHHQDESLTQPPMHLQDESLTQPPMHHHTEKSQTYMQSRNSTGSPMMSSEPNQHNEKPNSASSNNSSSTRTQETPYEELVSLVDKTADNHACTKTYRKPIQRSKIQSVSGYSTYSMDSTLSSLSSMKRSMSSPDLLSEVDQQSEEDAGTNVDFAAILSSMRLSSTTSESSPLPFVGYSESFNPIYSNKDQTARGATGLRNLGNTCFMNTAIQCLSSATILTRYFIGEEYNRRRWHVEGSKGIVAEEFAVVIYALWSGKYQSISPKDLHDTVCNNLPMFGDPYDRHGQHDVQEFLGSLIEEGLHKALNSVDQSDAKPSDPPQHAGDEQMSMSAWQEHLRSNQSIIVDLFQGQLRSVIHCNECQHDSSKFEIFTFLTLPIPTDKGDITLQDCLNEYSKEEIMEGDNAYQCSHCNKPCSATKRMEVWKLPQILLICLKRFSWKVDRGNSWQHKDGRMVQFPIAHLEVNGRDQSNPRYNLFAVANHIGGNTNGGHYTAYCLNATNKQWYEFDDNFVREISTDDTQTPKAYVLFYSCVDLLPPV